MDMTGAGDRANQKTRPAARITVTPTGNQSEPYALPDRKGHHVPSKTNRQTVNQATTTSTITTSITTNAKQSNHHEDNHHLH
jgi:hypothetical protein